MGIRVHKAVGYGMRGFKAPEDFGDRIEAACLSREDWADRVLTDPAVAAIHSERERSTEAFLLRARSIDKGLYHGAHVVVFDEEFGFDDAILICPPRLLPGAHRYDDLLDWLEERGECQPRWVDLALGIYPYDKGVIPPSVTAVLSVLGILNLRASFTESLYVKWS